MLRRGEGDRRGRWERESEEGDREQRQRREMFEGRLGVDWKGRLKRESERRDVWR